MTDLAMLADGRTLSVPLPRLVAFTHEDRAAKGLRAFDETVSTPQAPVQFTAFEMVSMYSAQLLHAPCGGGKTTLARHIVRAIARAGQGDALDSPGGLACAAVRNTAGLAMAQVWDAGLPEVRLSEPGQGVAMLAEAAGLAGPVLLILDALEHEPDPSALIRSAMAWLEGTPDTRLLILSARRPLEAMRLHPNLRSHALLPLPSPERQRALDPHGLRDPFAQDWVEPGLWALGLAEGRALNLHEAAALPVSHGWLREVRDAETLAALSPEDITAHVVAQPERWLGPLQSLTGKIAPPKAQPLAQALAATGRLALVLAAADLTAVGALQAPDLARALARVAETGGIVPALRRRTGEALARLGDPRTLDRLIRIPAGTYRMGGDLHPNSAPGHSAQIGEFRIAAYPTTCAAYLQFIERSGRIWLSADGWAPERASHPATDLTWHDARAYCTWLTGRWRNEGRLGPDEVVRLPTEREWEAAARGPQGHVYPWGDDWAADHANDDETGFNDICTVGLFPEGVSEFGCHDMAGQAWEWCTTLWGTDMTAPEFRFPWANDGRERLDAASNVRRVLRGGCFSSGRAKANGVYRGSLEPSGFWRGNGFRIVVS